MKSIVTILTLLFWTITNGQNSNHAFESSKGTWSFPIANFESADTIMKDCMGNPTSYPGYIILNSDCSQEVKAIQTGIAQAIFQIDKRFAVMVRSGDFYITYFGLSKPQIRKGDLVQQYATLGVMAKDADMDTYELTLILMRETKALNINRWFDWKTADKVTPMPSAIL